MGSGFKVGGREGEKHVSQANLPYEKHLYFMKKKMPQFILTSFLYPHATTNSASNLSFTNLYVEKSSILFY